MRENWRSADAYSYLDNLDSKAVAWEFLRRNSDYRAAYLSIAHERDAAAVASYWGCAVDPDLRADRVQITWLPTAKMISVPS